MSASGKVSTCSDRRRGAGGFCPPRMHHWYLMEIHQTVWYLKGYPKCCTTWQYWWYPFIKEVTLDPKEEETFFLHRARECHETLTTKYDHSIKVLEILLIEANGHLYLIKEFSSRSWSVCISVEGGFNINHVRSCLVLQITYSEGEGVEVTKLKNEEGRIILCESTDSISWRRMIELTHLIEWGCQT